MHRFANRARFVNPARPMTGWRIRPSLQLALVNPQTVSNATRCVSFYIYSPAAWLGMAGWGDITIAALTQLVLKRWSHDQTSLVYPAVRGYRNGADAQIGAQRAGGADAEPPWGLDLNQRQRSSGGRQRQLGRFSSAQPSL